MASEPKTALLLKLTLTSNTRATKKSRVLNYVYMVKGFQCHSNHSPQLIVLKKKKSHVTKTLSL